MTGKQLKNSILQWAIQGKLVPQDPNDEPASVLLEKIRQEKERLIKEKKIKRDKNASIIYRGEDNSYYEKILATGEVKCIDEEIPFEIPNGWEWVRLNSYSDVRDGTHDTPHYVNSGYPLITSKDFISGNFDFSKTKYIDEKTFVEINKRSNVQIGDILFSMIGGNIGSMILITRENYFDMAIKNVALFKQYIYDKIIIKYLCFYLQSQIISIKSKALGGAQSFVSLNILRNYLMPIPPLSEQQRIVSKLEEILPFVEHYEQLHNEINSLNAVIYEQLRKSILQEAIQGKLVPQIAEAGTAQELLDQIQAEKQRLVKEGKLKKSALSDSVIYKGDDNKYYEQVGKQCEDITEEIPFDLPDSWAWVRMGQIGDWGAGSTPHRSNVEYYNGDILWLKTGELNNSVVYDTEEKITQKALSECSLRLNRVGDILIAMYGATIGKVAIAGKEMTTNQACCGCTPFLVNNWYLFYFLMASRDVFIKKGEGGAQPNISRVKLVEHLMPLPPLQEQQRIVAQIERLFEQLK